MRSERDDRRQPGMAGKVEAERKGDLREPFVRDPRLPGHGEGERVGLWNAAMLQDPAAGRDVPADVPVAEHAPVAGDERRDREHEDREQQLVEEAVALRPDQRLSSRRFAARFQSS